MVQLVLEELPLVELEYEVVCYMVEEYICLMDNMSGVAFCSWSTLGMEWKLEACVDKSLSLSQ